MPPKKIIEFTVFILDCSSAIDQKLDHLYDIYSTKVFNRPSRVKPVDRQKFILINTPNNVEVITDWRFYQLQQLKSIRDACVAVEPQINHNNLLKGINQAITSFNDVEDKKNILIKRIIVLTDLTTPINPKEDNIIKLKSNLKDCKATLYLVGAQSVKLPKLKSKSDIKKLFRLEYFANVDAEIKDNLNVLRKMSDSNILVLNYEDGYHLLFAYKAQIKDPYPWYVSLGVGTDFRVPVMCYKVTRKNVSVRSRRAPLIAGHNYSRDKAWFDLNTHEEVPQEDVVRGYKFNGKFVSFTPEQEAQMESKKKTSKCLSILAFVDAAQIPINLYAYERSMHKVKPDRRSVRGNLHGFRLFVAGLRAKNAVAIAKRVYNNGNKPNLFAMFPCPEHRTNNYMLMCQIPYAHQFKERYHRGVECKLEEENPKLKQNVYSFLDAMTMNKYPNGDQIMPLVETLKFSMNRSRQYKFIAKKNLGEDPGSPPELNIHPYLEERAEEFADYLLDYLEH